MGRANLRVAAQANPDVASKTKVKSLTLLSGGESRCICLNENCQNRQVDLRGSRGDTQGKSCGVAREALRGAVEGSNGWI